MATYTKPLEDFMIKLIVIFTLLASAAANAGVVTITNDPLVLEEIAVRAEQAKEKTCAGPGNQIPCRAVFDTLEIMIGQTNASQMVVLGTIFWTPYNPKEVERVITDWNTHYNNVLLEWTLLQVHIQAMNHDVLK